MSVPVRASYGGLLDGTGFSAAEGAAQCIKAGICNGMPRAGHFAGQRTCRTNLKMLLPPTVTPED